MGIRVLLEKKIKLNFFCVMAAFAIYLYIRVQKSESRFFRKIKSNVEFLKRYLVLVKLLMQPEEAQYKYFKSIILIPVCFLTI